jgi:hypothetical protein
VAGVQAQRDAGAVEHGADLDAGLDHRADVRAEGGGEPAGRRAGSDPVQVAQQRGPALDVQRWPRVVPAQPGGRAQHEHGSRLAGVRRRAAEGIQCPVDRGQRVAAGVMQHHGHETARRFQPMTAEQPGAGERVGGQVPVRAEFGGGEAESPHLVKYLGGRHLVTPARHLADSP